MWFIRNRVAVILGLAATLIAHGQAPVPMKVGIIHLQQAIINTREGQRAANDLRAKFGPRREALDKRQAEIAALQDQLRKSNATLSDAAKAKLAGDIDAKVTSLKRDSEDFDMDLQEQEQSLMQALGGKLMKVVAKYAADNGIGMILNADRQDVIWSAADINISQEVVRLYNNANPVSGPPSTAAPSTPAPNRSPAGTAPKQ